MVTDVTLEWTGQTGTLGGTGKNEYVASYRVTVDDTNDGPIVVGTAPGLPPRGSTYSLGNEFDTTVILKQISPKRRAGHQMVWDAVCKWQPPENKSTTGSIVDDENPLLLPAQVSVTSASREEAVQKAVYRGGLKDMPIQEGSVLPPVNSAYSYYSDPLTLQVSDVIIRKSFNFRRFPIRDFNAIDHVNSSSFTLRGPGGFSFRAQKRQALISEIGSSLVYHERGPYWALSYSIIMRNSDVGWDEEILDRGLMGRAIEGDEDGRGGTYSAADIKDGNPPNRRIKDVEGHPISEPWLLDGAGAPLLRGQEPVYSRWQKYREANFNTLLFMRRN